MTIVPRRTVSWQDKQDLARTAAHAAMGVRFDLGMDLEEPISAYTACERVGVLVRFVDIDMEGIYQRSTVSRIFLSVRRPLVRRHFNCAHELGHHVFGHGASLDQLREDDGAYNARHPDEFLVDCFAAHLLMPVLGIRRAFSHRQTKAEDAEPKDVLAVASEFGVGYETLLTHLAFSLSDITISRRDELMRARQAFRRELLGEAASSGVALLDEQSVAPTLDVEVNYLIVAPRGTVASGDIVRPVGTSLFGDLFRASYRGAVDLSVPGTRWAVTIRVAPERFVGLAKYRYLEDDE